MTRARAGFTLIELIIVLVVLSGMLAIITPALGSLNVAESDDADRLKRILAATHSRTRDEGRTIEVTIAPQEQRIWWRAARWDSTATLVLAETTELRASRERVVFRFDPLGRSWGDSLIVASAGMVSVVSIEPATGRPIRSTVIAGGVK